MPLYEYRCQQCNRHTERRQKFSDPEITVCPHCGGLLERVLSAPNIAFKGGGWYKDLCSSSPKPAAGGEGAGDGKGDTKPDAAPSAKEASPKPSGSSDTSAAPAASAPAPAPAPASPSTPSSTSSNKS